MCYSTALGKKRESIERKLKNELHVNFHVDLAYTPSYHLNVFTQGNLYRIKMDEPKRIYPAKWRLVPDWSIHNYEAFWKKSNTLNARSESIFEKPPLKKSANKKHCLILCDGFYEPHHEINVSIPHYCDQLSKEPPEGDLFLFAGLFNELD